MPPVTELVQRDYQEKGSRFLETAGRAILADEAGLGKTNQLLMAAAGRTLVVSPAMLQDVWVSDDPEAPGEAQMWRPDLVEQGLLTWTSYSSLCQRGPDAKGRMSKVLPRPTKDLLGPWDTVIFDEAHYLKGRKTTWSIAAQKIQTDRLYMATGTPIVNWAEELFMLLQLLFPDEAQSGKKYGSFWRWAGKWFQVTASQWDPQARNVGDLQEGWSWDDFATGNDLAGRWLRRERDDVLKDMPPLSRQVIELPMTGEQLAVYRKLKKELYVMIESTGNEIISWSKGGVWTKLLKLTTGIEVEDLDYRKSGAKLAALREILVERTHPTLIFCAFRRSCEVAAAVAASLGKSVAIISGDYTLTERKRVAKEFQKGKIDVLVGTLGTMSEGLTLTAADTTIFLERDPRPSKNEQALRRAHRYGQTRPCLAIDLVTANSVDANIRKLLAEKTDQQMGAMRAIDALQLI